jgi:hypothetical protein
VHDAGLHSGLRVDRTDRVGQPLQAVDHGDQDVLTAARPEFIEHLEPELRPFGLLDPQAQHVALAIGLNAQGQIDCLVADHAVVADLHPQGVEEHHRIHRFERAVLPGQRFGHHLVSDRADEVG